MNRLLRNLTIVCFIFFCVSIAGATDFGMEIDPGIGREEAFVLEGLIDYTRRPFRDPRVKVKIGAGSHHSLDKDALCPIPLPILQIQPISNHFELKMLSDSIFQRLTEPNRQPPPEPPQEEDTELKE